MKWNELILCIQLGIYYLHITHDGKRLEGGLLHLQLAVLSDSQNCQKPNSPWFVVENSSLTTCFGSCIVRGRFLYRHASFKNRRTKKSVLQGQANVQAMGYPNVQNALRRYLLHLSIVTEHILKCHNFACFSVCRLCFIPPS